MTSHPQLPYQSVNPVTGAVRDTFEYATDEQIDAALEDGDGARQGWQARSVTDRAAIVGRAGDLFEQQAHDLARLVVEEMGKPIGEALEEVEFCRDIFRYYGDHGPALAADQPLAVAGPATAVVQKRPLGLLLGVMPWNFPLYQVARFAAPNLVLGNTLLLKHAESVPRCALAVEQLLHAAGVPEQVYRNIFATFDQIEQVIADPRVQGVSLTGSERAGSAVAALAGRHLKKCVLELGGSDPYIVLDTSDVRQAATDAWRTRMYNTGQACNSNKRMIVSADLYDAFVAELVAQAREMRPGDPLAPAEGTYSPLASAAAAQTLRALVADAVTHGATLHVGGELSRGAYYAPAVLTGVTPAMRAYHEELFGPVAVVYAAATDLDAVRLANDSPYGLGGAVFSSDPDRARRVADQLDVGMANVNTPAGEGADIPFGGVKRSGFGRELGPLGMDEFVNKRLFYQADLPPVR